MIQTRESERGGAAGHELAPIVIEARRLRKAYGQLQAVRGVDLTVRRGEVFCLLGPNGAGKTSVVEILEGYRAASGGEASVLGIPVGGSTSASRELRERVGIVLQSCGVQPDLTVAELVEMYGRYHRHPRPVDEVLELVELEAKRGERAGELSGGQRRRLDLALALVGDPELIFLDEPTTGFDPAARRQAWSAIRSLCELGKTIFLTTHFMDEAQYLGDRVAVMRAGEIIAEGAPDELGGRDRRPAEIRFTLPDAVTLDELPEVPSEHRTLDSGHALVLTREPVVAAHLITGWALERGIALASFQIAQPTLEDIYLELTRGDGAEPSSQSHSAHEEIPA
jgi:ABC-2 type transport system ATP-binding protein